MDIQSSNNMYNVPQQNDYLQECLVQQEKVAAELKQPRQRVAKIGAFQAPPAPGAANGGEGGLEVRITGFFVWKNVVVPPSAYVVHTRRGHEKPIHVGLGTSFRYNPYTDAFLVIPAAMQTILINARCICADRQGILVQAYVQWIIADIETAYRKLDFSDLSDPMRIVNVQLREQAEAAIKDKVSTMAIDAVLADKQPIIEELTHRLRVVAEGGSGSGGLGLKIVTVQIKEAVVSSARLWDNLQKPFRAEQEKRARLAQLASEKAVQSQELADRKDRMVAELQAERELAHARHEAELERMRTRTRELEDEASVDAATARQQMSRLVSELDRTAKSHAAAHERDMLDLQRLGARRAIENDVSADRVRERLVELLPEIAARLPVPQRLEQIDISSDGPATHGGAQALGGLLAILRRALGKFEGEKT